VHAEHLAPLVGLLLRTRPRVLHCWLDQPNCVGAVAGLIAGVPRILVSTRNLSPRHFPHYAEPWFPGTYRAVSASPRVVFVANSSAGAADYAAWSGVPERRFEVIPNGFDAAPLVPLSAVQREEGRARLGLPSGCFLVVGVFRLDPEKRPLDFLRVLARLRETLPGLRALHVGSGPLEPEVRDEAARLGLSEVLRFMGRQADPWRILALADAQLLCSLAEGCPNVVLEGQALQVPTVLTDAGGALEAIDPGRTGLAYPVGDIEGLSGGLRELAASPGRRTAMGQAGRAWVVSRFALADMVDRHLRLYELTGPA
jgi:glycosyltransferase involved in cell wall biosynthesis